MTEGAFSDVCGGLHPRGVLRQQRQTTTTDQAQHSDAARRLLVLPHDYIAPDLLFAEAANTIWKKIRREELTPATGRTVYDSMYVALAVRLNTRAITADDRLETALNKIPAVAGHIQLVQTFERDVQEGDDQEASN